jgi:hypothetical protein
MLLDAGADGSIANAAGFIASRGLDGDKTIGVACLMEASNADDVLAAFDLCEADMEGLKEAKISFVQAGMKIKKSLAQQEQWTDELQARFKSLSAKVL